MSYKQLYKSAQNKVVLGVCGGIGEYFGIDPTVIRIIWIILMFVFGSGVLAYIIAALIIPKEPTF